MDFDEYIEFLKTRGIFLVNEEIDWQTLEDDED